MPDPPCTLDKKERACPRPVPTEGKGLPLAPTTNRGFITVICGCMFSGKTTDLLRKIARYQAPHVLAVKHRIDTRYSPNQIVSHSGLAYPAVALDHALDIRRHLTGSIRIVAIDEAHFFDENLTRVTFDLARRGIDIVLTLLYPDSWGRPFPLGEQLRAIADAPIKLFAKCARCGATADHTQRLIPILDGNMVGGPESSEPRCAGCWTPPPEKRVG